MPDPLFSRRSRSRVNEVHRGITARRVDRRSNGRVGRGEAARGAARAIDTDIAVYCSTAQLLSRRSLAGLKADLQSSAGPQACHARGRRPHPLSGSLSVHREMRGEISPKADVHRRLNSYVVLRVSESPRFNLYLFLANLAHLAVKQVV